MLPAPFSVPDPKRVRMIVDTDCKNEADDAFALVHHLLTPMFDVRGIIAAHFERRRIVMAGRIRPCMPAMKKSARFCA